MRFILFIFFFIFSDHAGARNISRKEIESFAQSLVHKKRTVGISIAVLQNGKFDFFHTGEVKLHSKRSPNNESVYEIGSITKTLTGLLLAQAVIEKRILLTQPIASLLPRLRFPKSETPISLLHLATHRSGLASIYDEFFKPRNPLNPWADFDYSQLISFLSRTKLLSEPGVEGNYSNIGAALVGYALEAVYRVSYENLLYERIFGPLKMASTAISYSPWQLARSTQGYILSDGSFHPVPLWTMPATQAAGAVHSTLTDLSRLVLHLLYSNSTLRAAYMFSVRPHGPSANGATKSYSGLFWVVNRAPLFAWHNGSTYGSSSFIGIDPQTNSSVIILANTTNFERSEVTELGLHLMNRLVAR